MTRSFAAFGVAMIFASAAYAQPPGITREMIARQLPLEGAPLAVAGPYEAVMEPVAGSPRLASYRPAALDAFPKNDTLPVVVWGNGGCALDSKSFGGYLKTIASHGYLVVTTASPEGANPPRATADDLRAALDWSQAEATRQGSPLAGKIDKEHVAVMGVSCGGFLTIAVADDPRVDTIGVFNSGVQPAAPAGNAGGGSAAGGGAAAGRGANGRAGGGGGAAFPTTDALAKIHTPTLYLNGGEPDFMMATSKANFDAINHVPIFYGSRANAGHSATYFHPGGGEFANVAVAWLDWQLKGDEKASAMFVGEKCGLCTNPNWETHAKGLQ
jgi:dienelactone hydrolase